MNGNAEVFDCFWLPSQYYSTCISGANQNTIEKRRVSQIDYHSQEYFEKVTLPSLRKNIEPYPSDMRRLRKSKKYCEGFISIVNDALDAIYSDMKGYVYTVDQLKEILKFMPDIQIKVDDGIYYVSKGK